MPFILGHALAWCTFQKGRGSFALMFEPVRLVNSCRGSFCRVGKWNSEMFCPYICRLSLADQPDRLFILGQIHHLKNTTILAP
jgi:hypothetical protein